MPYLLDPWYIWKTHTTIRIFCPCLGEGFGCCSSNVVTRSNDGDDEGERQLGVDVSGGIRRSAVELGCEVHAGP